MPALAEIHKDIAARLSEVEALIVPLAEERDLLSAMLEVGGKNEPPATPAPRPASPVRRRGPGAKPRAARAAGRPRQSGVNRAEEAVRLITETPGITAAALAKAMMLGSPNYLYRVLPQLAREAKISKQGKGYHAVGSEA